MGLCSLRIWNMQIRIELADSGEPPQWRGLKSDGIDGAPAVGWHGCGLGVLGVGVSGVGWVSRGLVSIRGGVEQGC
jgi:hypothetical protein